jgi:hypothetical protein
LANAVPARARSRAMFVEFLGIRHNGINEESSHSSKREHHECIRFVQGRQHRPHPNNEEQKENTDEQSELHGKFRRHD